MPGAVGQDGPRLFLRGFGHFLPDLFQMFFVIGQLLFQTQPLIFNLVQVKALRRRLGPRRMGGLFREAAARRQGECEDDQDHNGRQPEGVSHLDLLPSLLFTGLDVWDKRNVSPARKNFFAGLWNLN